MMGFYYFCSMIKWKSKWGIITLAWILFFNGSCKDDSTSESWTEKGQFLIEYNDQLMRVFYYIPNDLPKNAPLLMVFHGANRNPMDYRNELTSKAVEKKFILVVPEFSEELFPEVNAYQMGNIFENGENPTSETLNPKKDWAFTVVKPIIEMVQKNTNTTGNDVFYIGHSAGAQFLHRMLFFYDDYPLKKAVVSAAGWYTIPDTSIDFPYGLRLSPYDFNIIKKTFSQKVIVQVGSNDNNPNAPLLRKGEADNQGTNRLDRAQFFFNYSQNFAKELNSPFNWEYKVAQGLNHSFGPAIKFAVDELFRE